MEPSLTTASTTVRAANLAYKVISNIGKVPYYWRKWFLPAKKVAVFGDSGSGKSTFVARLADKLYQGKSTRVNTSVKITLNNGRQVKLIDCPGQDGYRQQRNEIKNKINNGKYHAIINVVCYGYNEYDDTTLQLFEPGSNNIRQEYLNEQRQRELDRLDEWARDLTANTKLKWILTVINKADIWWYSKDEVRNYYKLGVYADKLGEIDRICPVHVAEYCSMISPFGGRPMLLTMSERQRFTMHDELMDMVEKFVKGIQV